MSATVALVVFAVADRPVLVAAAGRSGDDGSERRSGGQSEYPAVSHVVVALHQPAGELVIGQRCAGPGHIRGEQAGKLVHES